MNEKQQQGIEFLKGNLEALNTLSLYKELTQELLRKQLRHCLDILEIIETSEGE